MAAPLKAPSKAAGTAAKRSVQEAASNVGSGIDVKAMFERTMRRYPNTMARLAE